MNDRQKVQYLAEIIAQAEFVGFAVEILNAELELERPNIRRVFFSLQAILNHSANISKIIWGLRAGLTISHLKMLERLGFRVSWELMRLQSFILAK
ncbi:hypothetical protein ACFQDE_08380 [Deinococcus caeni]|uniref:hypothetical protein n=1 Tax=Deinococcus caeni TaxID=569127 RepID=UPI0036081CA4